MADGEEEEEENYFTIDDLLNESGDGQQVQSGGTIKSVRDASVQTSSAWSNHLKMSDKANRKAEVYRNATVKQSREETEASLRSEITSATTRAERAEEVSRMQRDELRAQLDAVAAEAGRHRARAERLERERQREGQREGGRAGSVAPAREPEPEPEPEEESIDNLAYLLNRGSDAPEPAPEPEKKLLDPASEALREASLVAAGQLQEACSNVVAAATSWPTAQHHRRTDGATASSAPGGWKAIRLGQHAATVADAATAALTAANDAHARFEAGLRSFTGHDNDIGSLTHYSNTQESRQREAAALSRAEAAETMVKSLEAEDGALRSEAAEAVAARDRLAAERSNAEGVGDGGGQVAELQAEIAMLSDALQAKSEEASELRVSGGRPLSGAEKAALATQEASAAENAAKVESLQKTIDENGKDVATLRKRLEEADARAGWLKDELDKAQAVAKTRGAQQAEAFEKEKSAGGDLNALQDKLDAESLEKQAAANFESGAASKSARVESLEKVTKDLKRQKESLKEEVEQGKKDLAEAKRSASAENDMLTKTIKEMQKAGKGGGGKISF